MSNQVTLTNGKVVQLPTFTENLPTTTSRDYYACENGWCCNWDGTSDFPNDVSGNNYVYPHADFSYSRAVGAFPQNWLIQIGTIYIDGVPSTNPLLCDSVCEAHENCIVPFGAYHEYPNQCPLFPSYGMYDWNDPTGNADAIATVSEGKIVGLDFVNNTATTFDGPVEGIAIPIQHQHGELILPCYPNVGDKIDDLILYKADTGTHYQLTQESYNIFINAVVPIIANGGFSVILNDLYFEAWNGGYSNYSQTHCFDCNQYNNDYNNTGDNPYGCSNIGKQNGCNWRNDVGGCYCANPEAGCCDEGSYLPEQNVNECRVDGDCRPGTICIRNRCVLEQPPGPTDLGEINCSCTPVPNCEEIYASDGDWNPCSICSELEQDILNNPNYNYDNGKSYCEYEFPAFGYNNLCNWSCSSDRRFRKTKKVSDKKILTDSKPRPVNIKYVKNQKDFNGNYIPQCNESQVVGQQDIYEDREGNVDWLWACINTTPPETRVRICWGPGGQSFEGGCPDGYSTVLHPGGTRGSGWYTPGDGVPATCHCLPMKDNPMGGSGGRGGR